MRITGQKGSILVTLVIAMVMMAALGAGIYTMTSSSSFSELLTNNNDKAYELARSGIRYAIDLRATNLSTTTFQMPDSDHTFTISIVNGQITSTGAVNPTSFLSAKRTLSYNVSWAPPPSNIIGTGGDMSSFANPVTGRSQGSGGSPMTVSTTNNNINLGGGINDGYASDWYQGSSSVGNCTDGACSFGSGMNVYFNFTFSEDWSNDSTSSADGFTFAIISAIQNTIDRTGGSPPGTSNGEFVGYSGPDNTPDGLGLKPPKMGIEFDTYPNGAGDICSSGSRNDHTPGAGFRDHIALLYWGARHPITQAGGTTCTVNGVSYPSDSFDDNRHGAGGSGNDPVNSSYGDGTGGYYGFPDSGPRGYLCSSGNGQTCNWLEDGSIYSARIEFVRTSLSAGSGGTYQVKAWVLSQNPNCFNDPTGSVLCWNSLTGLQQSKFTDVIVPLLSDGSMPAPLINRTTTLAQADHDNMSQIYWGITEATGGSTQNVLMSNLAVYFPQATACSYCITSGDPAVCSSSPITQNPPPPYDATAGGSGNINVVANVTCPWVAGSSDSTWLTVASGNSSGRGSGTVGYTVLGNNTCGPRTGYIDIGGQTYTVTQAGSNPPSINPASVSPGSSSGTGTVAVTAGTGCGWTATVSSTASWIHVTSGSPGTGNGSVGYSYDQNQTVASRTGTITIAGLPFTITQAAGMGNQTITFGAAPTVVVGGTGTVSATSSAGLTPVTFTSSTTSVCTASGTNGSTVTGVTAGTCTILATQAGNTNYNSATQTQTFTVGQGTQTITFGAAPTVVFGGTGTVSATSSAGLTPVTFTSNTTSVCTVSGTNGQTVTGVTAGNCTILATQAGNTNYNSATQTQTISVTIASYTIVNNTGGVIYPSIGGCKNNNTVPRGSSYPIAFNGAAVVFYQTRGNGNSCSGNNISISGANAAAADTNNNGSVQITNGWMLTDN
jgi:hypothetical protein